MVQKRTTILTRVKDRLGSSVTGLRNTNYWNIGDTRIWRSINRRQYPPQDFPHINIFTDKCRVVKKGRKYEKTLPVIIEAWVKGYEKNDEDIMEMGEEVLERITASIELDERFMDWQSNLPVSGSEIVVDYGITEESIFEFGDGIVYIYVMYEFVYFENYLGTRGYKILGQ